MSLLCLFLLFESTYQEIQVLIALFGDSWRARHINIRIQQLRAGHQEIVFPQKLAPVNEKYEESEHLYTCNDVNSRIIYPVIEVEVVLGEQEDRS